MALAAPAGPNRRRSRERCAPRGRTLFTQSAVALSIVVAGAVAGCGGDDEEADAAFVGSVYDAVEAVEADLGAGQQFFEVTANAQLTNVFVAIDDATVAVPYVFLDGELQPPAPGLDVESGFTFGADAIDFDPDAVVSRIGEELPEATIEALSVEGGADGAVRYVVAVRSAAGGALDVVVAADGTVLEVDPI